MDDVDLRGYLLALTTKGQGSFRGVLKRDRTIRKAFPADTLETGRVVRSRGRPDAHPDLLTLDAADGRTLTADRQGSLSPSVADEDLRALLENARPQVP
jgi:hypothetical protein